MQMRLLLFVFVLLAISVPQVIASTAIEKERQTYIRHSVKELRNRAALLHNAMHYKRALDEIVGQLPSQDFGIGADASILEAAEKEIASALVRLKRVQDAARHNSWDDSERGLGLVQQELFSAQRLLNSCSCRSQ